MNVITATPPSPPATADAAPTLTPGASEGGEPTMDELAALIPDSAMKAEPTPSAEPAAPKDPAEPAAEEPVKEPTVEEKTEKDTITAAQERAEKAAASARQGSARYKETQARLQQEASARQRIEQEAMALRREAQAAREREEAYQKDPYKALKDRGMTDRDLAERAMRENSPEALTLKLEAQLQEERQARIALERRIETERETARMHAVRSQAEAAFFKAAGDVDSYPELAVLRPAVQLVAAREALATMQANGYDTRSLTNGQIAEAAQEWLTMERKATPAKETKATPAPAKPTARPSAQTLTNAAAQTRVVAPANWDDLTDDQQIAHLAQQLPEG